MHFLPDNFPCTILSKAQHNCCITTGACPKTFLKPGMISFRLKVTHFRKAPSSQDCFRPNRQEPSTYLLPLNIHVPDNDSPICTTGDELPSVVSIGERLNFITEKETRQLLTNH